MYHLTFDIKVGSETIRALDKVTIKRSVETLCNTAEIVLPRTVYNRSIGIESKFKQDDPVTIKLGYDGKSETMFNEFEGFVTFVSIEENSITLECEDYMFYYGVGLDSKELKETTAEDILKHVNKEVSAFWGKSLSLSCDASASCKQNFVIKKGKTGREVLKEVQKLTNAEIYMVGNTLHCNSRFSAGSGKVTYDFSRNIESADLKYKKAENTKYLVIAAGMDKDGNPVIVEKGNKGGEVKRFPSTTESKEALEKKVAEEYNKKVYTGYEGSFTAWLVPYCDAGYTVTIEDPDNEFQKGSYYVDSVETTFSKAGGIRRISLKKGL